MTLASIRLEFLNYEAFSTEKEDVLYLLSALFFLHFRTLQRKTGTQSLFLCTFPKISLFRNKSLCGTFSRSLQWHYAKNSRTHGDGKDASMAQSYGVLEFNKNYVCISQGTRRLKVCKYERVLRGENYEHVTHCSLVRLKMPTYFIRSTSYSKLMLPSSVRGAIAKGWKSNVPSLANDLQVKIKKKFFNKFSLAWSLHCSYLLHEHKGIRWRLVWILYHFPLEHKFLKLSWVAINPQ